MKFSELSKVCAVAVFLAILLLPSLAEAESELVDITPMIEAALGNVDLSPWQEYIADNQYFSSITGGRGVLQFLCDLIRGEETLSLTNMLNMVLDGAISQAREHAGLAGLIAGIALITALLEKLGEGLFSGKLLSVSINVMVFSAMGLMIKGFAQAAGDAFGAVKDMSGLLNATMPILTTFIATMGDKVTLGALQPSVSIIATATVNILCNVVIPLLTVSAVLVCAHSISGQKVFTSLSSSTKRCSDWMIGVMFTVFFGFMSIQKLTASALGGLSVKTVKYTLSSFSLYGGAFLSKSFDVVTGCAVVLKSVIGGVGMLLLLTVSISPAIKLLVASVIYRFTAFLITLCGESRISGFMSSIGRIYGALFLCVMTCAILFFALISVMCAVGNSLVGL